MAKTVAEMQAEIDALKAQNQAMQKSQALGISFGNKQNVKVSGLQNFPTTLYYDQWERLLAFAPQITEFIAQNKAKLLTKVEGQAKYGKD